MVRFILSLVGAALFLFLWAGSLETGDPMLFTLAGIYSAIYIALLLLRPPSNLSRPGGF